MAKGTKRNNATPNGSLYFLWAQWTTSFKVGFTRGPVGNRAFDIEASSPVPIRILASKPGTMCDEKKLHASLREYRSHREWYVLPEPVVWQVLQFFGVGIPLEIQLVKKP